MDHKRKNKPGAGRPVESWTPAKVKLLQKLYPITDNATVAKKLGMTISAVRNAATRFGVTKKGWTEKDIAVLKEHYMTLTYDKIAAKLGKTKWAVINKARELDLNQQLK